MANFTFSGEILYPSSTYNISIDESETYNTPEKDYEFVEIPGRSGDLLFDNKRFKNMTISVPIFIRSNFGLYRNQLVRYLYSVDGYQKLTFPNDIGHYRMAAFYRAIEPETGSFNKSGHMTLEFNCKPQRFLNTGDNLVAVSSNTVNNPTNFPAKPLIRFYGNGTFTMNGYTVTVSGRQASQYIEIDCDLMTCSNNGTNLSSYVTLSNGYPILKGGSNAVSWTSDSSLQYPLQMRPRWWEI